MHDASLVADLKWAVQSPPLMAFPEPYREHHFEHLPIEQMQDQHWAKAAQIFTSTSGHSIKRLGHYFERLWQCWLEGHPLLELVEKNLQICEQKITVGEFDAIVFNHRERCHEHWEFAIKYYLLVEGQWLGPNLKDSLQRKHHHLLKHQIQLSHRPYVAFWLASKGMKIANRRIITRGALFYPWGKHEHGAMTGPKQACAEHVQSYWYTIDQFRACFDGSAVKFISLPKLAWLGAGTRQYTAGEYAGLEALLLELKEDCYRDVFYIQYRYQEHENELGHCMVVNDSWLNNAKARIPESYELL